MTSRHDAQGRIVKVELAGYGYNDGPDGMCELWRNGNDYYIDYCDGTDMVEYIGTYMCQENAEVRAREMWEAYFEEIEKNF